jgi:hypothetical protein
VAVLGPGVTSVKKGNQSSRFTRRAPAPGRRFRRGHSSSSPDGYGRAPHSATCAGAPTCPISSIGTWTARSTSMT